MSVFPAPQLTLGNRLRPILVHSVSCDNSFLSIISTFII
jgi:hypothetical protein